MKRILFFGVGLIFSMAVFSQTDTIQPGYKRFPSFPPIRLLLPDSSSYFTKNELPKKTLAVLMLFNPGCEHCRHETEEIIKNIDQFKEIHIVMATSMAFDSMMSFRERYKLADHPNIVVGQDIHYFLPGFFGIRTLPFLAFYNKKKELISVFQGSLPIPSILEIFKEN